MLHPNTTAISVEIRQFVAGTLTQEVVVEFVTADPAIVKENASAFGTTAAEHNRGPRTTGAIASWDADRRRATSALARSAALERPAPLDRRIDYHQY